MKPIVSLIILVAYALGTAYLLMVGFLGAINGEPLGFIFMVMGIAATIPYVKSFREFWNSSPEAF